MSGDETPRDLKISEKSGRKASDEEMTSLVDVMNRAHSHQCRGRKSDVQAENIPMNPPRSDAEMVDLSKKRLVAFS